MTGTAGAWPGRERHPADGRGALGGVVSDSVDWRTGVAAFRAGGMKAGEGDLVQLFLLLNLGYIQARKHIKP